MKKKLKRIQLFEFEDFHWFPSTLRDGMTNLIVVLHRLLGTTEVLTGLINHVRKSYSFSQIVDLGSGSGGALPMVIKQINDDTSAPPLNLILTDLHPNRHLIEELKTKRLTHITYMETPVDATNLKMAPPGLKTMINSFHHMPPEKARNILESAQENKQPLLIYEMGENFVPTILWWLLLPLSLAILIVMALVMTPFVKPFRWQQFIFTFIIPIIPITYAWDGQATMVRTYTFSDIEILLKNLKHKGYNWEMSHAKKTNGKKLGYYVLGRPAITE